MCKLDPLTDSLYGFTILISIRPIKLINARITFDDKKNMEGGGDVNIQINFNCPNMTCTT